MFYWLVFTVTFSDISSLSSVIIIRALIFKKTTRNSSTFNTEGQNLRVMMPCLFAGSCKFVENKYPSDMGVNGIGF